MFRTKHFSLLNAQSVEIDLPAVSQSVRTLIPGSYVFDIMIINSSLFTVFVRTGDENVVSDAKGLPIFAGEKGVYSKGMAQPEVTHIAAFSPDGVAKIRIVAGDGA